MGVLATLVPACQPAFYGGGVNASGTEGATWQWTGTITDPAGAAINLTTVTGTCQILTALGGTVVATPTFVGLADGTFTLTLDEAVTAGLATDAGPTGRSCVWLLRLSDGTDVPQMFGPSNSRFVIYQAG